MGFSCGIVGLPNVGKSTLFNALTPTQVAAENYPFCTIDPNVGIVPVPDVRLEALTQIVRPQRVIPTTIEFVDIAGLVAGAAKGEGLGNQFLAHIRETDAIAQVVRCFADSNVVHVAGRLDALADIETIQTELLLADLDTVERTVTRLERMVKAGDKDARLQLSLVREVEAQLAAGRPARALGLDAEQRGLLRELNLLSLKPMLYIANVGEAEVQEESPCVAAIRAHARAENAEVVPVCAAIEAEIAQLDEAERGEFLSALGLAEPGLNRVIRAGYRLLDLLTFFTAGPKEVRAWTVRRGATAPQAAGRIHSDFEKGFIRAEVIAYADFIAHHGETGAREAGKWRLEGKTYLVQEGDVMHFRFNV